VEIVTRQYKVYEFKELSEDAQEKAIEELYDINADYDWWDCTEEDAKIIGLDITEFDLNRNTIKGKFLIDAKDIADDIVESHGKLCKTHQIAKRYLEQIALLGEDENSELTPEDLDEEFEFELLAEYLSILRDEYEYITSREGIVETIENNEYRFTSDGSLFR
jgi:hypothetical protein